jgi:hypothetical protein
MDEMRSSWLALLLAIAVFCVAALGVYSCAYFMLGETLGGPPGGPPFARCYSAQWQVMLFTPAAAVESKVRGSNVALLHFPELN